MAEIHSERVKEKDLDTIMGEDIKFSGTLSFSDPLMIKGEIEGDVNATGIIYIEKDAKITANIKASQVQIRGQVIGDIIATESVQLFASAKVTGDITAPKVKMENGCFFSGKCQMSSEDSV
ncbi:MAG: polymer-forming cytoskeletal protein [Spirochaetales bacterium]|nr:polymer-forming cytoskeletal protein [Spirochaetales bacterium]